MSAFWDKVSSLFTGGNLVTQIVDGVDRFVTTKEEKQNLQNIALEIAHKQELAIQAAALEAEAEFNQRIKDLEGTAKDLIQAGWLGKIVLFLRGAQRPAWGWGTIIFDWMYFSGRIGLTAQGENLLYLVNALVLSFLFGERAIKNVAPFLKDMMQARAQSKAG